MLLLVEKVIREGICHALHWYVKDMICWYDKYMKDYDENKEGWYSKYWDVNNLYGWAISQKVPCKWFSVGWKYISFWWKFS